MMLSRGTLILIVAWVASEIGLGLGLARHAFTVDVAVSSNQRVVEGGPYGFVRHPSYTGILLSFVGLGILLRHWTSMIVLLVPITCALLYRIGIEERALVAGLGGAYADFMRRRRRLVPFVY